MILKARLKNPVSSLDHIQGNENALIVLTEYGDYECPYCSEANLVVRLLQEKLGEDMSYVFRNYPLTSIHPNALDAAQMAEAAGLQGKFWEMHDLLYRNQNDLDPSNIIGYSVDLNLDLQQLIQDRRSKAVANKIENDVVGGTRSGVDSTPSFFINGVQYQGDWSFEPLYAEITSILNDLQNQQEWNQEHDKAA